MHKFFLLMTLSFGIAASFLARADVMEAGEARTQVTYAEYDKANQVITVQGQLSTPCMNSPRPTLSSSGQDGVLVLDVVAKQTRLMCSAVLGNEYELAFEVHDLKNDLAEMNLDPEGSYTIVTRNGELFVEIDFSSPHVDVTGVNTNTHRGIKDVFPAVLVSGLNAQNVE
jgi:hypothetical protein